jgi:hypothetical protein
MPVSPFLSTSRNETVPSYAPAINALMVAENAERLKAEG